MLLIFEGKQLKYQNNKIIKKHAQLANQLLDKHSLPPTPINYSVFFIYVSGTNPTLKNHFDLLFENNQLDETSIIELYELHISQVAQLDEEIISPLTESIDILLSKLDQQVISDEQTVTNLQKIDKALTHSIKGNSLQQIVNYVQNTVNGSVSKHKTLSEELIKTNDEIGELKTKLAEAKKEAISDPLTGFLNRRGGEEKLAEIDIEESHTTMVIDIDHFKLVNDNFGHLIGDKVIQKVAQTIRNQISENDISVRYGGEEFVVVAIGKTLDQAESIAENIRKSINQLKLKQRNSDKFLPQISVSIGMAETKNDRHWQDNIARADKALYEAKNSGRNCIKIAA